MWTDRLLASLGHGRSTTATPNAAPCSESLRNTPIQPQISTNLDAEAMEANDDVLDFDNSLAEDFSSEAPKTDEIQITNARAETIADSPRQNRTHRADLDAGPDSNPANCAVPIEGGTKHRKRRVVLKFAFLHRTYRKIVDRAKRKLSSSKAQPDVRSPFQNFPSREAYLRWLVAIHRGLLSHD
ncbi:hypothetical protein BU16DRAFT_218289 [Lophium mytilinum]|uniref:Uncharacterized protein n=1 Tax=Lophium mytilinum TaxID=390894 RepID=A0A6A6Q923_9PEZI|nr:hypothetical protein BU16DRAFT_218289 [Lophium mytilinum]